MLDNLMHLQYYNIVERQQANSQKGGRMEQMTAKEILNLIDWLRAQGFDNDKVVECIEAIEGKEQKKEK